MRNWIKTILFMILLFGQPRGAAAANDEAPYLHASVDKKNIFIGDRIRYGIEARYKRGLEVLVPSFKDGRIGDFEIKDSGRETKRGFFGYDRISAWYIITIYSTGKQFIPPVEVRYRNAGSKDWSGLKTLEISINVQSTLPKANAPVDIKDVKGPFGFMEINWWVIYGIIILIAGAAFFIIKWLRRPLPRRLPHETAFEELEAARNTFLKNQDIKEYYVAISDCARRYIERAFKLKAPEMTTEEFLGFLRDSGELNMEHKGLLRDFLNACDLVKFAKYAPTKTEMELVYEAAKKFIEETKQIFLQKEAKG